MGKEREISDCIKALAGVPDVPYIYCIAKNVSETDFTCDGEPVMGDAKITGIKLTAKVGENNSVVVVPEEDSLILVAMTSKNDGFVVQCDKAAKIKLKVKNSSITIDSNGNMVVELSGNLDVTAKSIFMGGSNGVVVAPGLPPGTPIVDISQLSVSTKLKTS